MFLGYGLCDKPLRTGGTCRLPADHKTKHHTKCVFMCQCCEKTRRGLGPVCFICIQIGQQARELRRRYG